MSMKVHGRIRRRLLVNRLVDPVEAARRLPLGIRPHETEAGTVVGCCLLEIQALRPAPFPAAAGIAMRAAAHRISAEWEDEDGDRVVGVYVPERLTESRMAITLGGRGFPGVHLRATIDVRETGRALAWTVADSGRAGEHRIHVEASLESTTTDDRLDPVGAVCLSAAVGISPRRDGMLEGARMMPDAHSARPIEIVSASSTFLDGFASAAVAPSYVMEDVGVTWTVAPGPARVALRSG